MPVHAKLVVVLALVVAVAAQHVYKANDAVPLFSNKVGPYDNPDETYPYHDQKVFCQPEQSEVKSQHLGEHLEGDVKARSVFSFPFASDFERKVACTLSLDSAALTNLKEMIARNFYYELVLDDVPVHGFVGKFVAALEQYGLRGSTEKFYYFNHIHFTILFNPNEANARNNRGAQQTAQSALRGAKAGKGAGVIIYANVTRDEHDYELLDEEAPQRITFYYSAKWLKVDTPYAQRSDVYEDHFFAARAQGSELEVHWLAILNSTVLVLLLTGFVAVILLRILRSDLARYAQDDAGEAAAADKEDYGWKVIARDVFRVPAPLLLFTSLVGTGMQFIAMVLFTLLLAVVGLYYPGNDGALYVSSIVLFALTSAVGGFTSNFYYKKFEGTNWTWNTVLTATVFALPFFAMALFVNFVAMYYEVTKALPFTTVLTVLTIWALVGLPLTLIGSVAGKNYAAPFEPPVRTKHFARQIPDIAWYRHRYTQIALAGFLPFSSIYIELHYIFGSVWGRGMYQLWGILILVFAILFLVTAMTTVALTYFQLSLEDYRWWWISFVWGGSTGFYILGYSVYYWLYRSKMSGFLQASFYFGYQVFICYFFFLMLGSVGFLASFTFVKRIYKNLHMD